MNLRPCVRIVFLVVLSSPALAADFSPGFTAVDASPTFVPRPAIETARRQGNLLLQSVLAENGASFPGTTFTVMRGEPDAYGKTRYTVMAISGPQAHAVFQLSPGPYLIRAQNGAVAREETVDVPPSGLLRHQMVLDAGELQLNSWMSGDREPAEETWFQVFHSDTDAYGKPSRVQIAGNGYAAQARFVLPAGSYQVEATYGNASLTLPLSITAGTSSQHDLLLDAGRLEISSSLAEDGEPLPGTLISIYPHGTAKVDDQDRQRPVAEAESPGRLAFILPAGDYLVKARLDLAEVSIPVSVAAGEMLSREIPLQAGELKLSASLTGHDEPLHNSWFEIHRGKGEPDWRSRRGPSHKARYILPAGRYQVSVKVGKGLGRLTVDIEPGDELSESIEVDGGRINLRLVEADGERLHPHAQFSVYQVEKDGLGDIQRRRVFNEGFYADTDLILPSGEYLAFARDNTYRGELRFRLEAGETKDLTIVSAR